MEMAQAIFVLFSKSLGSRRLISAIRAEKALFIGSYNIWS
jgi:hypothetical protein